MANTNTRRGNFTQLLKQKSSFLTAVYLTLIAELFVTFAIVYWFRDHPELSKTTKQSFIVYLVALFGLILLLAFVPMPIWLQCIVFTLFAAVMGAWLHQVSSKVPVEIVDAALKGAIGVFLGMTVFGLLLAYLGFDLGWMGLILFSALIGLLISSLIVTFFMEKSPKIRKILLCIGLVLFSIYVTYTTNVILQKDYNENFVQAAIDFYLSFVNIFSSLLGLNVN